MLRVLIYYDNMSYERLEQLPSYDTLVWLGKFCFVFFCVHFSAVIFTLHYFHHTTKNTVWV